MEYYEKKTYAEYYEINKSKYSYLPISAYDFSIRTARRLEMLDIKTVGDLLEHSPLELMSLPGFGAKCLKEVDDVISNLRKSPVPTESTSSLQEIDNQTSLILKDHIDDIYFGNFDFINNLVLSENQALLLNKYKEAYSILGSELVNVCRSQPEKIIPIIQMLDDYSEIAKRYNILQGILNEIPIHRQNNKAMGYIKAYTTDESIRNSLSKLCPSDDITLVELINVVKIMDDHDYLNLEKFLHWCTFDLYVEIEELLKIIYKQERTQTIIKMRAQKKTLEYIGNIMGVTRERVRQIEAKAKTTFSIKYKNIRIISKISAERDGDTVLTREEVTEFCGIYTDEIMYFLQDYEGVNFSYDKQLDVFIVGDDSLQSRVNAYIDTLPEIFKQDTLPEIIKQGEETADIPEEILEKAIEEAYKITGEVYHRVRLSLSTVYTSIIEKYYPEGLHVYDPDVLDEFRMHVVTDYGDVEIANNNRALSTRIAGICVLCGKGKYRLKKKSYISASLTKKIHDYIVNSSHSIFLTNTIFAEFENELIQEGIDNKYYLQGILHELFEDEFFFRRDYISKDPALTSMYSSIVNFIKSSDYPISKEQLKHEFPGVTEIIFNLSIEDPEILNFFGEYLHACKLNIATEEKVYLKNILEDFVADGKTVHCKDVFEIIDRERPEILSRNAAQFAFSTFSILEYLFRNDYQFSRPYIAQNGVEIGRAAERLHDLIYSNEIFDLSRVKDFSSETHYIVYSLLDLANSCNDEFLLMDTSTLVRIDKAGITEEIAKNIEQLILEEVTGTMPIAELTIWNKLPAINVSWSDWLIYSIINKWAIALEVSTSSNQLRQSVPLISRKGYMDAALYKDVNKSDFDGVIKVDNLDNIDELIEDYIGDEIWEDEL